MRRIDTINKKKTVLLNLLQYYIIIIIIRLLQLRLFVLLFFFSCVMIVYCLIIVLYTLLLLMWLLSRVLFFLQSKYKYKVQKKNNTKTLKTYIDKERKLEQMLECRYEFCTCYVINKAAERYYCYLFVIFVFLSQIVYRLFFFVYKISCIWLKCRNANIIERSVVVIIYIEIEISARTLANTNKQLKRSCHAGIYSHAYWRVFYSQCFL
jgi:hypothetical protein